MPMIVANNLNALATRNALNSNNSKMSGSLERLSTGYKINSGKDDPSGLVISEQLRAQNVGLERAVQNTQEANNVLGIAEGALNEMNNILKKMRQLAIHSANNGVTSPEQVAADQAEVDSSIQTLDRIARTTKFSDQFLLNGNKELQYESSVMVTDSKDMKLVNENLSDIRQIFKRSDFKMNINFSGAGESAAGKDIDNGNEAQKGYFEVSRKKSAATQLDENGELTQDQAFTLSGNKGSRYLSFAKGTQLGEMVTSINSVKDSTGVEATLVFDSDTTVSGRTSGTVSQIGTASAGTTEITATAAHASGMADVYNRTALGEITTAGVQSISVTADNGLKLGENIDGDGRVYLKMVDGDSYELYKDAAMTMKVAEGDVDASGDTTVMAVNNSELTGIDLTFGTSGLTAGATATLQLGVQMEESGASGDFTVRSETGSNPNKNYMYTVAAGTLHDKITEVSLSSGNLPSSMAGSTYVFEFDDDWMWGGYSLCDQNGVTLATASSHSRDDAANTASMTFNYLGEVFTLTADISYDLTSADTNLIVRVGFDIPEGGGGSDGIDMSGLVDDTNSTTNGSFFNSVGSTLSGVNLGENTSETGKLYLKADLNATSDSKIYAYKDARMRDEDLVAESGDVDLYSSTEGGAVRLYASGAGAGGSTSGLYGTLNFNQITQDLELDGTVIEFENLAMRISAEEYGSDSFVKVDQHEGAIFSRYSETDGAVLLDAGLDGEDWTEYGRDATISLNGQELKLDGTTGTITNLDTTAKIVFNEGTLGCTTLAAVGYNTGSWASRASMLYENEGNYLTHALHNTTETLGDWEGGMQFQLGEGAGDQERTVLSLKNMTATELGKVSFLDSFETDLESEKMLSINDMLSGGWASLGQDPVKALEIIDQAIEDVSGLRANIGAFQANMLETNANSLNVAIENITKTESYIRDADMASESTDFSKNQIMVQAGTSMLAQANQLSQNALSLIS